MELKLFTPALLEEARRDVMGETIEEYRLKFHECLKQAGTAEQATLLNSWNIAENHFRVGDFDGLAQAMMYLNAAYVLQQARLEMKRREQESNILVKRLAYTVRLKFEEAETEEDMGRVQAIVDELDGVDVRSPHYIKQLKSILNRLDAL